MEINENSQFIPQEKILGQGYKAGEFYSQSWGFTNNDTLDVNA